MESTACNLNDISKLYNLANTVFDQLLEIEAKYNADNNLERISFFNRARHELRSVPHNFANLCRFVQTLLASLHNFYSPIVFREMLRKMVPLIDKIEIYNITHLKPEDSKS